MFPGRLFHAGNLELPCHLQTISEASVPYNVDFGLITEDGIFHFLSVDSGSFDKTITVSERGNYTFAVRNNSSKTINVSGYVNY